MINDIIHAKIDVLHDKSDMYPYAYDTALSGRNITLPSAVVFPRCAKDVQTIVKIAKKYNLKIISRGAGTCHTSGCKPVENSIVVHFSKMNNILEINKQNLTAIVESGVIVGRLQSEVDRFGLFFPPDPSNLRVSTIGGAIALSSGGARAFKYGTAKDYVINLEVVLSDGTIMETAKNVAKNVTGYNLTSLFTGSEGTLGIITKATLKLIPKPETKALTLAYFDTLENAACAVNNIINALITPSTIDIIDKNTIDTIERFNPSGLLSSEGLLLIETDGSFAQVEYETKKLCEVLKNSCATKVITLNKKEEIVRTLNSRRSAFACMAKLKPNVVTEDVALPRENILPFIKSVKKLCDENELTTAIMGHAGDGNIHPNFALDFNDKDELNRFYKVKDKIFELAIALGGTLSGEHGIGFEKKKYLKNALDKNAYLYMKKMKEVFDPDNIFNPELLF